MKTIKVDKKIVATIAIGLMTLIFAISIVMLIEPKKAKIVPSADEEATAKLSAHEIYNKNMDISLATLTASANDYSAVIVKDRAIVTIRDSAIKKYDGLISDKNELTKTGLNSAIVVAYGSELKTTNSRIETTVEYTNGIFISGEKAKAQVIDSKIFGYGTYTNGAVIATKGKLELEHSDITTKFKYSPAIVVTHKAGKADLKNNVMLETNGSSSPLFKSKGTITMNDSTGTANGSRFAILEGGTLTINKSTLISAGANDDNMDQPSGMIIKGKEETTINITDSSLNINSKMPYYQTALMFDIINAKAILNLKNAQINYGSNRLVEIKNSQVTINCDKQTLQGKILVDSNSSLNINIKNNSIYIGSISGNNSNTNATLSLDQSATFILQGDTYVKELKNADKENKNINFGKYKLYVAGQAIN